MIVSVCAFALDVWCSDGNAYAHKWVAIMLGQLSGYVGEG